MDRIVMGKLISITLNHQKNRITMLYEKKETDFGTFFCHVYFESLDEAQEILEEILDMEKKIPLRVSNCEGVKPNKLTR